MAHDLPPHSEHPQPSLLLLGGVYVALMVLLGLTVLAAGFVPGRVGLVVGLAIATVKTLLVILYFMQVRTSAALTRVFVVAGFVWLSILFTLTWLDYVTR